MVDRLDHLRRPQIKKWKKAEPPPHKLQNLGGFRGGGEGNVQKILGIQ